MRARCLFLGQELVEKLVEDGVALDADHWVGLAVGMDDGGGGLVDVIDFAESEIFLDERVEGAAFYQCANFGHFGRRKNGCHGAVQVSGVLPLFLILKKSLLDELAFSNVRGGTGVLRGDSGVRMHG